MYALAFVGAVVAGFLLMLAWNFFSGLASKPDNILVGAGVTGLVISILVFIGVMGFMGKKIVKFLSTAVAAVVIMSVAGCTVVEPGYVGIKVNQWGDQRGVEDYPILMGVVGYNPFTSEVYTFPTFQQRIVWSAGEDEGSPTNESITFNSSEGASVNIDVGLALSFDPAKVPQIFIDYKIPAERIVDGYVRDRVRNQLMINASNMKVADIFGEGQAELIKKAEDGLKAELAPKGIMINDVSFLCRPRVSETVEQSINAVIAQKQRAIEAEQKVMQATAEANQAIARAEGEAKVKTVNADAEAYQITAMANAQAEANKKLAESISSNLINYEQTKRWNGVLPVTVLGNNATPLIKLN